MSKSEVQIFKIKVKAKAGVEVKIEKIKFFALI
jgi:hypothetical protein